MIELDNHKLDSISFFERHNIEFEWSTDRSLIKQQLQQQPTNRVNDQNSTKSNNHLAMRNVKWQMREEMIFRVCYYMHNWLQYTISTLSLKLHLCESLLFSTRKYSNAKNNRRFIEIHVNNNCYRILFKKKNCMLIRL